MQNGKFFHSCEVLQFFLKVWVKCDYFEALHIEMHVHISNLNIVSWFWCFHSFEVYSIDSSKMIGNSPEVLNFNQLFLKHNQFICN